MSRKHTTDSEEWGPSFNETVVTPTWTGDLKWRRSGTRWTGWWQQGSQEELYRMYLCGSDLYFDTPGHNKVRYRYKLDPQQAGQLYEAIIFSRANEESGVADERSED